MPPVVENTEAHRFELPIAEGAVAAAYYRLDDGVVVLTHTEVPSDYMGGGIGSRLADGVFAILRATGRKAVARCDFMRRYVAVHPGTADLVVG